jgi:hypothetical protein
MTDAEFAGYFPNPRALADGELTNAFQWWAETADDWRTIVDREGGGDREFMARVAAFTRNKLDDEIKRRMGEAAAKFEGGGA